MRTLRERLAALSRPPASEANSVRPTKDRFFLREHVIGLSELDGIEQTTIAEIRDCDPLFAGERWALRDLILLDTETTGLSGGAGTVAFEIGVGIFDDRGLVIRQYVMRDYHEEEPMLADILRWIDSRRTLVTFNGKTFDIPLLESRLLMYRYRPGITQWPHLDLLHACRRVYKMRIGRCSLDRIEQHVLGLERKNDLPGAEVPQRYFTYLKTGEFALIEDVLSHNLQDVISLARITARLCMQYRKPEEIEYAEDLLGVGRTCLKAGNVQRGRTCLRRLKRSRVSSMSQRYLADSYKKERDWEGSIEVWKEMIDHGEGEEWPYIELAKYYEHRIGDCRQALSYAEKALLHLLNYASIRPQAEREEQIRKRIRRLKRKCSR